MLATLLKNIDLTPLHGLFGDLTDQAKHMDDRLRRIEEMLEALTDVLIRNAPHDD